MHVLETHISPVNQREVGDCETVVKGKWKLLHMNTMLYQISTRQRDVSVSTTRIWENDGEYKEHIIYKQDYMRAGREYKESVVPKTQTISGITLLAICIVIIVIVLVFLTIIRLVFRPAAVSVLDRHQVVQAGVTFDEYGLASGQTRAYQCTNGRTICTILASSFLKSGASTCWSVNLCCNHDQQLQQEGRRGGAYLWTTANERHFKRSMSLRQCEGKSARCVDVRGRYSLVRLVDALRRDLQFVLKPEHILARSLGMWMCRPEERFELGRGDNLPQAAGGT